MIFVEQKWGCVRFFTELKDYSFFSDIKNYETMAVDGVAVMLDVPPFYRTPQIF